MKPVIVIVVFCLFLMTGIMGCTKIAPENATPTIAVSSTIQASIVTTSSPESTDVVPTSIQTVISSTPQPLIVITLEGTSIPPIVLTQDTPESTPTPESPVQERNFPNALIQIIEPDSQSQLASPIKVRANVFPGAGYLVGMQLYDEDEQILSDQLMKMMLTDSGWVYLSEEIQFEITTAGESALLVLTTRDEFDRRIAQSASQVLLIQIGKSEIETNDLIKQPFVIQTPRMNTSVSGGVVHIEGFAHPFNSNPIIIELLTESGGVLESQTVRLPRNFENQNFLAFSADIPYAVDIPTPVRLTIRQRSEVLPNIDIALSSQLLTLEP